MNIHRLAGPVAALVIAGAITLSGCSGTSTAITAPAAGGSTQSPAAGQPAAQSGTREHPAALGSKISGKDWEVVVNSVALGANDAVKAANQFNGDAPVGSAYAVVNYTATYIGKDAKGGMPAEVGIDYVTPEWKTISRTSTIAVAPAPAFDGISPLYNGAATTGNIVIAVPTADGDKGVLAVRPGMLADTVFVAVK